MLTFGTYKKPVFQWEKVMRDVRRPLGSGCGLFSKQGPRLLKSARSRISLGKRVDKKGVCEQPPSSVLPGPVQRVAVSQPDTTHKAPSCVV